MYTIADQNGSPVVPCLEQHVLKVDFGDALDWCNIEQITQGSTRDLEVANRVHHALVLLRDPVGRPKLIVGDLRDA